MPLVRRGRVVTRSSTGAVQRRQPGGRTRGSNRVATVVDGDGNVNAVGNNDVLPVNNDAGQEGAAVVGLDPK